MTYVLNFIGKFGLWELRVNRCRIRFYRTRDEAMKCVTRYRRMLQSECDREERNSRINNRSVLKMSGWREEHEA